MYSTACVVNLHLPPSSSSHKHSTDSSQSSMGTCCGILMDTERGLVLAHASCLGLFVEQGDLDLSSLTFTLKELRRLKCEVLLQKEKERSERCGERVSGMPVSTLSDRHTYVAHIDTLDNRGGISTENSELTDENACTLRKVTADIVHFFHCPVLRESLETLMPQPTWELLDKKEVKDKNNNSHRNVQAEADMQTLLSSFIMLRLRGWRPYASPVLVRPTKDCRIGERVEICSTPFGGLKPDTFINSYSRGIVSNLAGKDNCLLLSDARCVLGGEGAPLYTFQDRLSASLRCVTGVVVASLCWKSQEWVGFCVACDIGAVLQSASPFFQHPHQGDRPRWLPGAAEGSAALQGVCCPEVVMLKVGSTWGSGVVVGADTGTILTCSHVVREAHLYPVEVQTDGGGRGKKTRVVYRQHPVREQFDLAVVQTSSPQPLTDRPSSTLTLDVADPVEGMEVYVVGHALFGAEHHLPPSVTSGVISKVIKVNKIPVMIQTTCAVHPGASGGALVDTRGRLVGIVVCNTRDNSCGASFPHVNMSIPACTVWPVISRFLQTQEVKYLERLRLKNSMVDTIWALGSLHDTGNTGKVSKL